MLKKFLKVQTGIDGPMPDHFANNTRQWADHLQWNGFRYHWKEDLKMLSDFGFRYVRLGLPWSEMQPKPNEFRAELFDPIVNQAEKLGLTLLYVSTHYNQPLWVKCRYDVHQIVSPKLPEALAKYTEKLVSTYGCKWIIPMVEIGTEVRFRGGVGDYVPMWAPHKFGLREQILDNAVLAFSVAAKAARQLGAKVFCSEAASDYEVAKRLAPSIDALGMNFYSHYDGNSMYLQNCLGTWGRIARLYRIPMWLTEAGSHENFIPSTMGSGKRILQPYRPGIDSNRLRSAEILESSFRNALAMGLPLEMVSWYPAVPNMWRTNLTVPPGSIKTPEGDKDSPLWCDRAGLMDGIEKRVPCIKLINKVLSWNKIEINNPLHNNITEVAKNKLGYMTATGI